MKDNELRYLCFPPCLLQFSLKYENHARHYAFDHHLKSLNTIYNWSTTCKTVTFEFIIVPLRITQSHPAAKQVNALQRKFALDSTSHINRNSKCECLNKFFLKDIPSLALHAEQMFNHALQTQAELVSTNETLL